MNRKGARTPTIVALAPTAFRTTALVAAALRTTALRTTALRTTAIVAAALTAVSLVATSCASTGSPRESRPVEFEVVNDLGPSFEVRVSITPVAYRSRTAPIGWVRLGEDETFRFEVQPGRYYLNAAGAARGQTAVLRERNPKSTRLRSDTFTIDDRVERITWTLSTNHLELQPPR